MGIYLLNISVDSADPKPDFIPENLSFNDQESILEIIIEQILGFENAIAEYDDHDTENHTKKSNIKIDLVVYFASPFQQVQATYKYRKQRFAYLKPYLNEGFIQFDTPPPKILI